jgi:tetratricopeptide (TPR) repeat protein
MALQWKRRAPDAPGADLVIATGHLARGRHDNARAVLERYVAKGGGGASAGPDKPHVAQATILYCQALASSGKVADAEKLLGARIAASPQYRAAWIEIASRYLPDNDAAARWLDAAAQAVPEAARAVFGEQAALAEGWVALATRTGAAAHKECAAAVVRALSARTAASPQATAGELVVTGMLCEGIEDRGAAEAAYNLALAKNPAEPVALNNLALILADRDETGPAEKLAAQAAARQHPRQASFYDTLATIQAKARQWPQAGKSIEKARELDPTNLGYQIHQAVILVSSGDTTRARSALNAVEGIRLEDPRLNNTDRERLKSLRQRAASGS